MKFIRLGEKKFTVKAWKKFDYSHQSVLLRKFDIILTDHQTKSEKIRNILSKFNAKNVNKGIDKFQKATDTMDKAFKEWDKLKRKNQKDLSGLIGK